MTEQTSPLSEADPRSLDEIFNSKPPFSQSDLRRLVEEFRRMRAKWQQDEIEGKRKKAEKAQSRTISKVVQDDIWGADE